ncbi:IMP cyclohydrolase [Yanshouia hominis]|uniref:IMP cyclohydrolase n=1 Tax=Yanshouia hominis TaxID=2763673 RepID=A0ABR7NMW3_9FIRM|nr:IMP cyclohydrolase [Yanshouia hominis]MBC8577751.1 IMP cyclohydrolase [Yanshouia hominis]
MNLELSKLLRENSYPGRGIVLGRSSDGRHAVIAYFIMGRSENSRNRVFSADGEGIRTQAYDPSKLTDPSLIIYAPVRVFHDENNTVTIVTNGDQTDTVYDGLAHGMSFSDALRQRTFEPDGPNYTPRISGAVEGFGYVLSILKSANGNPDSVRRYYFEYPQPVAGEGHFIHTYRCDGNPLPSFEGEPEQVLIEGDIDSFTNGIWDSLNAENRVSLFVRFIDVESGAYETRIVNRYN